tara:strand:- start:122733 stop:122837 length:105 start_codon:yes stop_codon:yes gene_type:complete
MIKLQPLRFLKYDDGQFQKKAKQYCLAFQNTMFK